MCLNKLILIFFNHPTSSCHKSLMAQGLFCSKGAYFVQRAFSWAYFLGDGGGGGGGGGGSYGIFCDCKYINTYII